MQRKKHIAVVKPSGFNQEQRETAHDAITRLLHRLEPDTNELWQEAKDYVDLKRGILVLNDTVLDHWYAKKMELVRRQWSGKHKRVVQGINQTTVGWSDGDKHIPF